MLKQNAQTKVEFFDDAGEIQIVPIDTIIDDGGFDLGADDSSRDRSQGSTARGKSRRYPRSRMGLRMLIQTASIKVPRAMVPADAAGHCGRNQILWLEYTLSTPE